MEADSDAVEAALQALRHRDLSTLELRSRLAGKGFSGAACDQALATLQRTGIVDDDRLAQLRTSALARQGAGDALIRHRLEAAGVGEESIQRALESVEDEALRARRIVVRRGGGSRTARYLVGKGFSEEVVRGAVAARGAEELG